MNRSRTFPIVLVLAAVLTCMLGVSAYLQYQWLNQLSVAEEVRIRTSIENAAHQLGDQINQEMMSALFTFVVPAPGTKEELSARLSERWLEWTATSTHSGLVKHVYWLEYDPSNRPQLFQFNPDFEILERVSDWHPQQHPYPSLEAYFEGFVISPVPLSRRGLDTVPVIPFESALLNMQDHLFIVFDVEYISEFWIPELTGRFFHSYEQAEYDILITERDDEGHIVFASNNEANIHENADIRINIGPPDPRYILRFLTRLISRPQRAFRGPVGNREGQPQLRAGMSPPRIWTLYIAHKSGALETAVSNVRRRNLGVSFLVLIVLGGSVGLILIYTRRMRRLANQQMAFVAGVSHDIKTPIAVMHAIGENLRDGLVHEVNETQEYGMLIVEQSRSLLNTANQVLTYSGITAGAMLSVDRSVDFNKAVQEAIYRIELDVKDVEIDLSLNDTLPEIRGDEDALVSMVQNLVQNAVKYSLKDPCIGIATFEANNMLHLTIKDTGCGIAPEDRPFIFEPFYRAEFVRASQIRGNGLGLTIVKNIVEAHHGSITFQSEPGRGTTFHVMLPSVQSSNRVS